jgi:hypothetical protein
MISRALRKIESEEEMGDLVEHVGGGADNADTAEDGEEEGAGQTKKITF